MVLFLLLFVLIHGYFAFNCFGISSTASEVCSGNGLCVSKDTCFCNSKYIGNECNLRTYEDYEINYNIEASRLVCGGENKNGICDNSGNPKSTSNRTQIGELQGKTIRELCVNKYWGLATDSEYEAYVWGSANSSSYLSSPTNHLPKKIGIGKIKQVACTSSSLFVLKFDGSLLAMGKSEHGELGILGIKNTFTQITTNVHLITASEKNVYITFKGYDSAFKRVVYMAGEKYDLSGNYAGFVVVDNTNFKTNSTPRIIGIDRGALYTFPINYHLFAGNEHPSTLSFAANPTLINFSTQSQLTNAHSIDFIGRSEGGCMIISSENKIYVSGSNCPSYSLPTPSIHPYLASEISLNDYHTSLTPERIIVDLKCAGKICYILTEEQILAFGKGMIGIPQFPSSTPVNKITTAFTNLQFLIPAKGSANFFSFSKPIGGLKVIAPDQVNRYPPKFGQSGLNSDILTIRIIKDEAFNQFDPLIKIGNNSDSRCQFEGNQESRFWKFQNFGGIDEYTLTDSWASQRLACGWKKEETTNYKNFRNRILFSSFYSLNYKQSLLLERREDFALDVLLKFKNWVTLDTLITVSRNPYDSKVLVSQKSFDPNTREGDVFIDVENDFPLVVGTLTPTGTRRSYIEETVDRRVVGFSIGKMNITISQLLGYLDCSDFKTCRQKFQLHYSLFPGVCDPSFTLNLLGNVSCGTEIYVPPIVVNPPGGLPPIITPGVPIPIPPQFCQALLQGQQIIQNALQFVVDILGENVCAKLSEDVSLAGNLKIFKDWGYTQQTANFKVGDYVYFRADVIQPSGKATIETARVEDVTFNGNILMLNNVIQTKGKEMFFGVDTQPEKDKIGFHFALVQKYMNLTYGEIKQFAVIIRLKVSLKETNRRHMYITRSIPIEGLVPNSETYLNSNIYVSKDNPTNFLDIFLKGSLIWIIGLSLLAIFIAVASFLIILLLVFICLSIFKKRTLKPKMFKKNTLYPHQKRNTISIQN